MDLGLRGKVAVVTGSSRGIGRAIATSLAAEGASVVLNARGTDALADAARALQEQGRVVAAIPADVTTLDGCETLIRQAAERFGGVDVLVSNVGGGEAASLFSAEEQWLAAADLTVWPSLRLSRLVVPSMRQRGGGAIVLVTSIFGREAGGRASYQVVKSAETSLGKALARELAREAIRVVSVAPGSILFEGGSWWRRQQADPAGIARFVEQELPLGRFGRPEEVGDVVAFLCSERASLVTGASIPVDGSQGRSII